MSLNLSDLNEPQRQAVLLTDKPVLLLAGAGSGKTRVITVRIAHLLERGIPPEWILALTFTNKAAKEMNERVSELVPKKAKGLTITTFHSLCVRILREYIHLLGYQRDFVIFDTTSQQQCLKNVMEEMDLEATAANVKSLYFEIMTHKGEGKGPEFLLQQKENPLAVQMGKIFASYNSHLKDYNALDFEDILFKAQELFLHHTEEMEPVRERWRYLMVDEYQDTNKVQYRLVKELAKKRRQLCVVGDDDQSIYGWRGADIRNILDFQKDFPEAEVIRLEQNYRSSQVILDAANSIITHNAERMAKKLWTQDQAGQKLTWVNAPDPKEEMEEVVHQMQVFRIQASKRWADCAFLYRSNFMSRSIEEVLRDKGIPYQLIGGLKFFDRKEIQDCLAYMRFLHNPKDEVSLFRVLNYPRRGIGKSTIEAVAAQRSEARGFYEVMKQAQELTGLSGRALEHVESFVKLIEQHKQMLIQGSPFWEVFQSLFEKLDLKGELERSEKEEKKREQKVTNYLEFLNTLYLYGERRENADLAAFLDYVSLFTDQDGTDEKLDKVNLLTIHSAKGLEFDFVALVGMVDGQFPNHKAVTDGHVEEERRLMYVAITRAKKRLVLSMAQARMVYGEWVKNLPSRFVGEINPSLFDKPPVGEEPPEAALARKEDARAKFLARFKKPEA